MNPREEKAPVYTSFWPLCLMALSLIVLLGWQVTMSAQQCIALVRLADQQTLLTSQAMQAESKLQGMITDLLTLAKTDPAARAVVTKYGIKFNPGASPRTEEALPELKQEEPTQPLPASKPE